VTITRGDLTSPGALQKGVLAPTAVIQAWMASATERIKCIICVNLFPPFKNEVLRLLLRKLRSAQICIER
jgi:hypothetical protein